MKYYQHAGEVWAYELDGSQDALIPDDAVQLTQDEVKALLERPEEQSNARRIGELKALLAATDYKVLSDYDKPDPAILAQRQAWRDEIRALQTPA